MSTEAKPISGGDLSPVKRGEGSNKRTQVEQTPEASPLPKATDKPKSRNEVDLTSLNSSSRVSLSDHSTTRTLFNDTDEDLKSEAEKEWKTPGRKISSRKKGITEKEKVGIAKSKLNAGAPSFGYFTELCEDEFEDDTDELELPSRGGQLPQRKKNSRRPKKDITTKTNHAGRTH